MSPIMGDTSLGVVARRTYPSGVASFGRVTRALADPEPCTKRPDGAGGGSGGGWRRAVLGQGC